MNVPASSLELFQHIPAGALYPSPTNPRKTFDTKGLEELADSLRNEGVLSPLLVRPDKRHAGGYEVIAGERRLRAAKLARLASLPCVVRDLTDAQVELHQAIEWVQRADLHPLEEAEAYEGLAKRHGMSAEDIAAKVSKSESYIRGRMKLCALSDKARKWFLQGSLTATTALLVARIPVPSLQDEAVEHLVGRDGNPLHATAAAQVIRDRYMTRLHGAPFDTGDATLVPAAGPCGPCHKRTGNQAGLFGDVKDSETCTDPQCFGSKRLAASERRRVAAEMKGQTVIAGKAAEKAWPKGWQRPDPDDFVIASERCYEDPKGRTFAQIVGREARPALIENPGTGELVEVFSVKEARAALKAKGVGVRTQDEKARDQKAQQERAARLAIFGAVRANTSELTREDLAVIARAFYNASWHELRKRIAKLWSFEERAAAQTIDTLPAEQLVRLIFDLALVPEVYAPADVSGRKPETLEAVAARQGIDTAAIRARIREEAKAAEKAKKKPAAKAEKAGASADASSGSPGGGKARGRAKSKAKSTTVEKGANNGE